MSEITPDVKRFIAENKCRTGETPNQELNPGRPVKLDDSRDLRLEDLLDAG